MMISTRSLQNMLLLVLCAGLTGSTALAQSAPTAAPPARPVDTDLPPAKQILSNYVNTIGGEERVRSRTSMLVEGKFQVPSQGMNGDMTIQAAAPNLMHVEIEIEGLGKFRQGFDGKVGWTLNPLQGPALMEGLALADVARQADFYSELNFDKNYKSIETVGRTNFEGIECYEVRLMPHEGSEASMFFDVATGLLVGMNSTAHLPQGDFPTTTRFEDYKDFDGIKMPTRITNKQLGVQQVMIYDKVTHDAVDKSVFELPQPIKALLESPPPKEPSPPPPGAPKSE
jgi:hypothetical protein